MLRRDFLKAAGLAAGAAGLGASPLSFAASAVGQATASRALRILILGGTGFIGPYQVRYAVDRGHQVSVFNRGRRQADLPESVEHLQGDRNGDLDSLRGREWDVVIDNPTTLPVWVRDAASLLKDSAGQYIFVSTISVYGDNTSQPGMDEMTPVGRYEGADPMAETMESFQANRGALYGPLKALSEKEAEKWFPGRTTVVRPGLIVGPGDPTDRFTYWPVRVARGGEVLAPGTPSDPVQIIDARDLSEWIVRLAEQRTFGTFNATGPAERLGIGEMLGAMRPLARAPVSFTWADAAFLRDQGVSPWSDMPVWVPPREGNEGFADVSIRRALERGLTLRPLPTTARDTLAWHASRPAEEQAPLRAGLSPEREAEVLRAWHARPARSAAVPLESDDRHA